MAWAALVPVTVEYGDIDADISTGAAPLIRNQGKLAMVKYIFLCYLPISVIYYRQISQDVPMTAVAPLPPLDMGLDQVQISKCVSKLPF